MGLIADERATWLDEPGAAFDRWHRGDPDALAFTVAGHNRRVTATRRQFAALVNDLSKRLLTDDRRPVAVAAQSTIETAAAIWAVVRAERQVLVLPPPGRRSTKAGLQDRLARNHVSPGSYFDGERGFWPVDEGSVEPDAHDHHRPTDGGFLVLTSGTTGEPAICLLTSRAAFTNIYWAMDRFGLQPGDVVASWLPLHHDLGLFSQVVMPVIGELPVAFSDPLSFLRRPLGWLDLCADSGAVATTCPSFAMRTVTRLLARGADLAADLSDLRHIGIGAELIPPDEADAFAAALAPHGLAPEALHASYGLAETTMVLATAPGGIRTATLPGGAVRARHTVLGRPTGRGQCRIVDSEPASGIGRIQFRSETQTVWKSSVGPIAPSAWIETGDRGAVVDGEIVVVGRWDDTMTINGRQISAVEPEELARSVAGVVDAAAMTTPRLAPTVVVFVELERSAAEEPVFIAVRSAIKQGLGLTVDVRRPPRLRLPRTTSGKVTRHTLRRLLDIEGSASHVATPLS